MLRRLAGFIVWFAGLTAALAFLLSAANYGLGLPAMTGASWHTWLESSDPATIVFTFACAGASVAVAYLLASSALLAIATVLRFQPVIAFATVISTPAVRRVIRGTVGVSIAGVLASPSFADAQALLPPDAPILVHLAPGDNIPTPATTVTTVVIPPPVETQPQTQARVPAKSATHVVVRGDNLWSISKQAFTSQFGRDPNETELRTYWAAVIQANRDRLLNHDNADLIFPGQIIELPTL